jgi:hypothetical protein
MTQNQTLVDRVVDAVLYEGYILYPYRPSVKNRQRWTFGGLYPRTWSEAQGGTDPWVMQTQCLVEGTPETILDVTVRFLHLRERRLREHEERWQEATERRIPLGEVSLASLVAGPKRHPFVCPPDEGLEPGQQQHSVEGAIEGAAAPAGEGLFRVTVRVENETALAEGVVDRDEALLRSLASTHTVLSVREGAFVSLMDPPLRWCEAATGCSNVGTWPVLVGEEGERNTLLSSPIILYDYPQVAPESPGDLFDCTEIDEILTLRVLTLTDEEKRQAAAVDERARALLERTEALARDQLLRLHGIVRGLRPLEEGKG